MSLLYLLCYLAVAVFIISVVTRSLKLARLPQHVRWELYPVAHDAKRAHYGGSYLEEPEWWTKPRESSMVGELKVMVPEILLLSGVRHHNKSQWWRSFPFHFGLYLLIATTVLLLVGGILGIRSPGGFFGTLIPIFGYGGLALGLIGSVALLQRRMSDEDYREYTNPVDYLNLLLFAVALGIGLFAYLGADANFLKMRGFFAGLFSWGEHGLAPLQEVHVVLMAVLVAYVPMTHMSHFFTKVFMYHGIRWGDEPLNEKIEKRAGEALTLKPTWAAPHIAAEDGTRTWVDIATTSGLPEEGEGGDK